MRTVIVALGSLLFLTSCAKRESPASEAAAPATPLASAAPSQLEQQGAPGAPAVAPSPMPESAKGAAAPAADEVSSSKSRKKDESAPSSLHDEVEHMDLAAARAALSDAVKKLDTAVQLATPDCPTARELRDRICELSGRICRLTAGPDPLCKDSSARCDSAKTRVASECP